MLKFISASKDEAEHAHNARYEIVHSSVDFSTIVTADLDISVLSDGSVKMNIDIGQIDAQSFNDAREAVAKRLERVVMGLREPIKETMSFPVYKREH